MQVSGASCSHLFISNCIAFRSLFIFSLYNGVTDHFAVPSRILVHHHFRQSIVVQTTYMPSSSQSRCRQQSFHIWHVCSDKNVCIGGGGCLSTRYAWCIANDGTANLTSAWYPYCIVVQIPEHTSALRCKPLDRPRTWWRTWYPLCSRSRLLNFVDFVVRGGGSCIDRASEVNKTADGIQWITVNCDCRLPYRAHFEEVGKGFSSFLY